jgi:hypothetical protein
MQNNKNLEVEYRIESISKQDYIENLTPGYKLYINDKVRVIEKIKLYSKKLDIMLHHFTSILQI